MQYEQVKELIEIFEKTDLNDMEVTLGNASVRLNRGMSLPSPVSGGVLPQAAPVAAASTMATPVMATTPASVGTETIAGETNQAEEETKKETSVSGDKVIKAPIVGTFYQSAAPDQEPYVKVGDTIAEGDVVCIIEAMKFMNEVTSEVSGTITDILIEDGQFVEFGQELFRVK